MRGIGPIGRKRAQSRACRVGRTKDSQLLEIKKTYMFFFLLCEAACGKLALQALGEGGAAQRPQRPSCPRWHPWQPQSARSALLKPWQRPP